MTHDVPPSDEVVLGALTAAEGGLTPRALMERLVEAEYSRNDVVNAIQRVFDRGLVELGAGARLVVVPQPIAA